ADRIETLAPYFDAPGARDARVSPPRAAETAVAWTGPGLAASLARPQGANGGVTDASATVDRTGLEVAARHTTSAKTSFGGSAFLAHGYASVGASAAIDLEDRLAWCDQDAAALYLGGHVAAWKGFVGVGGNVALATDTTTVQVGGYVSLSADRSVRDLGPYEGDVPALAGRHGVEIREQASVSARVQAGLATGGLGIGGRLQVAEKREAVFRTFVDVGDARAIVAGADGVRGWARGTIEALGLAARSVPFPELSRPDTLRVGDEVVLETTGSLQGGVVLGGFGATLGAAAMMDGSFQLGVRRIDADHVELVVAPKRVKGIGLMANLGGLAVASATKTLSLALRQAFVFDLREPTARAAYHKALHGTLPTSIGEPTSVREHDDERLLAAMRHEALPAGVTRTFLEKAEVPMTVRGVSTGLLFLPEWADPAGLSYHHLRAKARVVTTDGSVAVSSTTRGIEDAWDTLFSGKSSVAVSATVERETRPLALGDVRRSFARLVLRARLADSKVVGRDLNAGLVAPINAAFGTTIDPYTRAGRKQSREVRLERVLDAAALDQLARASVIALRRACAASGAKVEPLTDLVACLGAEHNPWDRAELVQRYVAREALAGFGAIHQLLGEPTALTVHTTSDAYERPVETARRLAMELPGRIEPRLPASALNARFQSVQAALDDVKEALRDLDDDAIMHELDPGAIAKHREQLANAGQILRALIAVDHLTPVARQRVYEKLTSRTLLQRADLLAWKYQDPIHASDEKADVKKRFTEVLAALDEVSKELAALKKDAGLARVDLATVAERQRDLLDADARLKALVGLGHLSAEGRGELYLRLRGDEPTGCLPHRRSAITIRILGALEALGITFEHERPLVPAVDGGTRG
ncbi:hypothetical protein L6R52_42375, partial [Myxococcota bacterium]|nr:hypothetical protein [Myxococcota bacterium]